MCAFHVGSVIEWEETIMSKRMQPERRHQKARSRIPVIRRLLTIIFAALTLVLVLPPAPASAHAELMFTIPTEGAVLRDAPTSVELTFDEPVSLVADGFQLYDSSGRHRTASARADAATVLITLPSTLSDGSYVLAWRVVSDDFHPESGVLSFAVGQASVSVATIAPTNAPPVDVLYAVLNAVGYLGLFGLVGLTVFDLFVARTTTLGRLPRVAGFTAVSAYVILVPLTAVRIQGAGLVGLFDPAVVTTGRSAGALLTLGLAALGVTLMLLRTRLPRRKRFWVGTVGAGFALVSVLPVGHTRVFGPPWLVMGADLIHAATAAVWLGGLVALILHIVRAQRSTGDRATAAIVLGRFSTLAGGVVVLLGVTGTILAVSIVGSIPALVGSVYGRMLLVKLGMVAVIGGLALWNRFGLVPHVAREGMTGRAWNQLKLAIRLEAVGVILVVGLTSALTLQNPRASEFLAAPAVATGVSARGEVPVLADLGTGHLTGRFSPGTTGVNVITFDLTDVGGAPIVPLAMPRVSVSEPNLSLGPLEAAVEPGKKPGNYRAVVALPVAGQWKFTAAVRVNELEQPAAVIDVVVVG